MKHSWCKCNAKSPIDCQCHHPAQRTVKVQCHAKGMLGEPMREAFLRLGAEAERIDGMTIVHIEGKDGAAIVLGGKNAPKVIDGFMDALERVLEMSGIPKVGGAWGKKVGP